jgi:hypothetical protein
MTNKNGNGNNIRVQISAFCIKHYTRNRTIDIHDNYR